MFGRFSAALMVAAVAIFAFSAAGCTSQTKDPAKAKSDAKADKKGDGKKDITVADTKHEGWWCQEHGIPEEICSLCSSTAAAKFKKEGDWCKIHDRAQSQCFKCDPDKYAKYEAMYVAKYGKKPERPPEEEFKK